MTATFDFDRLLESVLESSGPQSAPLVVVDAALAATTDARQRRPIVRALDRQAWPAPRLSMGDPATARLMWVGLVMLLTLALAGAAIGIGSRLLRTNDLGPPGWSATGSLSQARTAFTATLLPDGRVLVAGGGSSDSTGSYDSAELYDPETGSWSATGNMVSGRRFHTATLLPDGKVLAAGGSGAFGVSMASAELYDPARGEWTSASAMTEARGQHVAVQLPDGKVLVAGGAGGSDPSLIAEVYDPKTGTWTATGPMTGWRASPTATLLESGQVLVAGGFGNGIDITSAELFEPVSRTWTATGSMSQSRVDGTTATLLPDGDVLVVGGPNGDGPAGSGSTAELYDPVSGTWSVTAPTREAQGGHTATLLPDGTVLVAGGISGVGTALALTQSYDPLAGTWTAGPPMVEPRYSGIAVPLLDERLLVVGGTGRGDAAVASAELYTPAAGN